MSPNNFKELTTSSESPAINEKEVEGTVSTAEQLYIIDEDNNTVDDNLADKVVIEAMVDKSDINTVLADVLIVPWIDQEWLEFMSALLFITFFIRFLH